MKPAAACLVLAFVPALAWADARTDVQAAFQRVIAAGGFRAHAEGRVFGPDLPPVSGEIEAVFPDRIHARTDTMEFIITREGAWVSAFGVWTPADRSLLPVTAFDPASMRQAVASIRDVREEGRAGLRQCASRVYRFRASGQLPARTPTATCACGSAMRTAGPRGSKPSMPRAAAACRWCSTGLDVRASRRRSTDAHAVSP
jgi:hypothetical protein